MLGRRKTSPPPVEETAPPAVGKGRPTPRRHEAEAARRRPLVVTDRRAAAKASRERLRSERLRTRSAMETGDERYLPARDKGPARRYTRDLVDARRNVGEYLLFAALGLVVLQFALQSVNTLWGLYSTLALWFVVLAVVVDSFLLNRHLKKRLAARFGDDLPAGTVRYGVLRALQIRRSRLPKPQVRHGEQPR
ncbi:DUF3043 domain-containing protein [Pseudokineococcus sp. 5B2Z-1]|uniref:DUF3043 domain-containing protein n=1 Tax=Pseudokineococcus sp. 5B2Z-1 TaxID=3132744 RepID=UPI002621787C|nr:DUF3043 domain-containing protein [uncultured Pseudokineococcus sp.]